ncbi:iron dicitrate transport regulator FecR [Geoanaerobacter pelophilus]|uniref:Iron dicitrate transport regulator FecR n=1 Tax=Geoanaerobacter pelophilus TaxID=60036 RepID=A0ABQ0MLP4_9BACT|nr:FecR family protein [Geoanaerobacter pelophilus]GAW68006.1 iron dicitrate transport regulator FecR [Geoanaerobacter pelophilus]
MQRILVLISLLLPLMLLTVPGSAWAEVVGKLTVVEGAVDIMPGGQLPAVAARVGGAVQKGDFVRTKSNARAELTFNDGSVIKIAQRSRIDVGEYSASNRRLALPRGKVQATVIPAAAGGTARSFEIRTPNAIAGVRGTSFYVYHQANVTGVAVLQGVVHTASLSQPSKGVTLVAGTATTVTRRGAPTPPRPVSDNEMNSHQSDVNPTGKQGGEPQAAPAAESGDAGAGSSGSQATSGTTSPTGSTTADSPDSGSGSPSSDTPSTGGPVASSPSFTDPSPDLSAPPPQAPAPVPTTPISPTVVAPPVTDLVPPEDKPNPDEPLSPDGTTPDTPPTTDPGGTTPPPATPPVFSGTLAGGLMSRGAAIDPGSNLLTIVSDPGFAPVISGTTSPWATKSASISLAGSYPTLPLQQPNHYWFGNFFSDSTPTHTTTDGGAFFGYFGGSSLDSTAAAGTAIEASLSGIYVDPTGKIGLMQGGATGAAPSGKVSGTGTLTLTEMTPTSTLLPASFGAGWWDSKTGTTMVELTGPVLTGNMDGGNEAEGYLFDSGLNYSGTIADRGDVLRLAHLAADPSFGIWTRESFGSYAGSGSQLVLTSNGEWGTIDTAGIFHPENTIKVVSLGNWQQGALSGKADGVWADVANGSLKLLTGTLTGSVTPDATVLGPSTFGAVTTGVYIDLNRFLANPTLAAGLGFPTLAGVDSFTLNGSNSTGSVNFGTLKFYGRSGSPLSLWVAQNVSGSFGGTLQQQNFSLMNGATASSSSVMGNLWVSGVNAANGTWLGQVNAIGETGTSFRNEFDGVAVGTVSGTTFSGSAAGIAHPVTYYNNITGDLRRISGGSVTSYGTVNGVMGGMSLWNAKPSFTSEFQGIGFLTPSQALTNTDYVFSAPLISKDLSGQAMTADGGAYYGQLVAGVSTVGGNPDSPGIIGAANALYIDPAGKAGVLQGKFSGFLDPSNNIWQNEGEFFPVELDAAPSVTATTLNNGGVITGTTTFVVGASTFTGNGVTLGGGDADGFTRSFLTNTPQWGIGNFGFYAPVSSGPAANTPWSIDFVLPDSNLTMVGTMAGHMWDPGRGQMAAGVRAGWYEMVNVDATATPKTGIFIGETVGTFNPVSLQSITSGMWLETNKFLSMVMSDPGALNKLKIPAVEVGKADFSGGNGEYNVTIQNLRFFAPVATGRPEIFATDSISGSYVTVPTLGSAATLNQVVGSGVNVSGFSPTFTVKQWDTANNKWSASLQFNGNSGAVGTNGNVQFTGVAAGRSNPGASTFTGTAAGVVK